MRNSTPSEARLRDWVPRLVSAVVAWFYGVITPKPNFRLPAVVIPDIDHTEPKRSAVPAQEVRA